MNPKTATFQPHGSHADVDGNIEKLLRLLLFVVRYISGFRRVRSGQQNAGRVQGFLSTGLGEQYRFQAKRGLQDTAILVAIVGGGLVLLLLLWW